MGLFSWVSGQFIDIIEWTDSTNDTLVWRFPRHQNEIKNGAQLIVREGQVAVFIYEGQLGDVFTPGMYTLTTQNIPVISSFSGWKYGFESPFKCEVYFVNTRQYLDMKWGTVNPIAMTDSQLGIVRLRACGSFAIKVSAENVSTFIREVVGTDGHFTTDEIHGQLRSELLQAITQIIGSGNIPALELARSYRDLAEQCRVEMGPDFQKLGLEITKFVIESISLPEAVSEALDQRTVIQGIGDMSTFTQYQAAQALREAAQQPGGMAGMSMGMGAGVGMGQMMASVMGNMNQQSTQQNQMAPAAESVESRLTKLKGLMDQGLIDEATFNTKRDAILADL